MAERAHKKASNVSRLPRIPERGLQASSAQRKQDSNLTRLVPQRKQPAGRIRFLEDTEYERLCRVIQHQRLQHLAEFIVSVHTGMRLSEQYTV
jgi:hypothetical protein